MAFSPDRITFAEPRFQAHGAHKRVSHVLGEHFGPVVRGEYASLGTVQRVINGEPRTVALGTIPSRKEFGLQTLSYSKDGGRYVEVFYSNLVPELAWVRYAVNESSLRITPEEGTLQKRVSLADRLSVIGSTAQDIRMAEYMTFPFESIL